MKENQDMKSQLKALKNEVKYPFFLIVLKFHVLEYKPEFKNRNTHQET